MKKLKDVVITTNERKKKLSVLSRGIVYLQCDLMMVIYYLM